MLYLNYICCQDLCCIQYLKNIYKKATPVFFLKKSENRILKVKISKLHTLSSFYSAFQKLPMRDETKKID